MQPLLVRGAALVIILAGAAALLSFRLLSPAIVFVATLLLGFLALFALFSGPLRHQQAEAREQHRRLEARRSEAESRATLLQSIADATPLALLFYSDTGRIAYANPGARELFFEGQSPEGKNFLDLVGQAPEPLRHALLGESDELFTVDVDNQRETYHLSRRTFDAGGELHTLLIVRHLTREVSRREVEVLKRVIRVISHELNNSLAPIASLVHSARLIAKTPEHLPKLAQVFDTIEDRAQHLSAFLETYARFARLPKPRKQRVEWAPLLERIGTLFPDASIAPVAGDGFFDPTQIEQVLINLLKNSREAGSPGGSIELRVTAERDAASSIEVLDRGKGLSKEALENAFLPFYSTKERGSGMGLALCREIVEAHGGQLGIKNRDGGGSIVSLWLPGKTLAADVKASRARLTLTRS